MVYITGDLHGNQWEWLNGIEPLLHSGDTILFAGDFGFGMMYGPLSEEMFYDRIEEKDITLLFVDGNHENFDRLNAYPVEAFCGGKVHKIRKNVLHLMRGEIFDLEGSHVFAFGGGYSLDRYLGEKGKAWWSEEMPSAEEYQNAEENLDRVNGQVDFIVTHTAPLQTVDEALCRFCHMKRITEDRELTHKLETFRNRTSYRHWFFGHYHLDAELWRGQTALLHAIRELETGRIVGWKTPNKVTRD